MNILLLKTEINKNTIITVIFHRKIRKHTSYINSDKKSTRRKHFSTKIQIFITRPSIAYLHISAPIIRPIKTQFSGKTRTIEANHKTNRQLTQRRPRKPPPCGTSHYSNNKYYTNVTISTTVEQIVSLVR